MRVSTSTGMSCRVQWDSKVYFTCEESVRAIAAAGYDAVDLGFVVYGRDGYPMAESGWQDWVKRQKEICDEVGLPVTQSHAHYYSVWDSRTYTPLQWEDNTGRILRDIEASGICRVPWMVLHPDTAWDEAGYSRRLSLEKETERCKRFGELAAKWNVGIAIENMIDNKAERRFGGTAEDLMELLDRLGDDKLFGICWDTGHAHLNRLNQPESLRQIGSRLKALHINDNRGQKDDHVLPYVGHIQWGPVLKALKEIKYAGDFTYEIHNFTSGFEPGFLHTESMKFACLVARKMVEEIENS